MFLTARAARLAAVTAFALVVASACSGDDDPAPEPGGLISATTMRGALLQAADIGPSWQAPADASSDPTQMVSFCGGTTTAPSVPPGAEIVASSFADEGDGGAQTLDQTALVFADADSATTGETVLRGVADGCPTNVSVPATVTSDKSEPAYTETVEVKPLEQDAWKGFAVVRHKKYEPKHPGTADTAVVVLRTRNVVLVEAYAIYKLKNASTGPNFDSDWQKLVGTVIQRVG